MTLSRRLALQGFFRLPCLVVDGLGPHLWLSTSLQVVWGEAHSLGLPSAQTSRAQSPLGLLRSLPRTPPPPAPRSAPLLSACYCSPAGLPGHPSVLPIGEPTAHAPNLVSLKLKTCSTEPGPLQRRCTLIIPSEGAADLVSAVVLPGLVEWCRVGKGGGEGEGRRVEKLVSLEQSTWQSRGL